MRMRLEQAQAPLTITYYLRGMPPRSTARTMPRDRLVSASAPRQALLPQRLRRLRDRNDATSATRRSATMSAPTDTSMGQYRSNQAMYHRCHPIYTQRSLVHYPNLINAVCRTVTEIATPIQKSPFRSRPTIRWYSRRAARLVRPVA